jgi:hypothetical protein
MRTWRGQNDIDVHAIWRAARRCGFSDVKLAVFNGTPFMYPSEYEDFLAAGQQKRWLTARVSQRACATSFCSRKALSRRQSRGHGLGCAITATLASGPAAAGLVVIDATVTNNGTARWLAPDAEYGGDAARRAPPRRVRAHANFDFFEP